MGEFQPCSRRSKHIKKQLLISAFMRSGIKKAATPAIVMVSTAVAFMCLDLLIPAIASAHLLGPGFILFILGFGVISFAVLTFAIGFAKYAITAYFFGSKLAVSRNAFMIIMTESAIFTIVLLGATPVDIASLVSVKDAFLGLSESLVILIFYSSIKHPYCSEICSIPYLRFQCFIQLQC